MSAEDNHSSDIKVLGQTEYPTAVQHGTWKSVSRTLRMEDILRIALKPSLFFGLLFVVASLYMSVLLGNSSRLLLEIEHCLRTFGVPHGKPQEKGARPCEKKKKNTNGYIHNHKQTKLRISGWWFGTFFIFPYIGNNHPNCLIFFRGVQTTNQIRFWAMNTILSHTSPFSPGSKPRVDMCVPGLALPICGLLEAQIARVVSWSSQRSFVQICIQASLDRFISVLLLQLVKQIYVYIHVNIYIYMLKYKC